MKLKVLSLLLLLQFDSAFVCLFHRMNDGGKSRRWRYLFFIHWLLCFTSHWRRARKDEEQEKEGDLPKRYTIRIWTSRFSLPFKGRLMIAQWSVVSIKRRVEWEWVPNLPPHNIIFIRCHSYSSSSTIRSMNSVSFDMEPTFMAMSIYILCCFYFLPFNAPFILPSALSPFVCTSKFPSLSLTHSSFYGP